MTTGFENSCTLSDYADCIRFVDTSATTTIYIGDFRSAMSWKLLQDANVTAIVNCSCSIPNMFPQMFDYCNVNIADVAVAPAGYGFVDGDDSTATAIQLWPSSSWLDEATAFVHSHSRCPNGFSSRGATLVHCRAGQSRSVAIVVAYAIRYHRWTRDAALAYIRHMRKPRTGVATAPNRGFLRQLYLYQYRYLYQSFEASSSSSATILSQYYTVEWAKECRNFYQTLGMPDVCPQHTRWIIPVVLAIVAEDPAASMQFFQAVWIKLGVGPSNHRHHDHLILSTGWPETFHAQPTRPVIRASRSF